MLCTQCIHSPVRSAQWPGEHQSIRNVSLSPSHSKRVTLRFFLQRDFKHPDGILKEKHEFHYSQMNPVDFSTGRYVSPILVEGLWRLDRVVVKCTTLHIWAVNLDSLSPIPEWHLLTAVNVYMLSGSVHGNRLPGHHQRAPESVPVPTQMTVPEVIQH